MYSPTPKSQSHMESITQEPRPGLQVYKEVCNELGKQPSSNVTSGITGNTLVLKVDALMNHEMKSLKLLFERHQFQKIALYKESLELGDIFDPKTASLKPKYFNKSPQFSMSQKSFSRMSSGIRPKSPQSEQKKAKAAKTNENLNLFCKILVPQLTQSTTLESLRFFCISFTKEALKHLAVGIKGNQTLKELSISYCDLTSQDLEQIFAAIGENNNLNFLDLSHNQLDDNSGRMLGSIIGVHGRKRDEILWVYSIRGDQPDEDPELKGICDLNVSFNQLGSKALTDMCGSLKYDTWLKNLNLRGNQIGEEGIIELKKVLAQNNSIFAIDLRDNPFYNPKLSREIITKLATNIQNYKNKNMMLPPEESSQTPYEEEQNPYENVDYIGRTGSDKMNNQGYLAANEEIDALIKKYEANGLLDGENQDDEEEKKVEGVSFGFRNEKIKENLRKDYKKLRVKQTRSEGRVNFGHEKEFAGGEGGCPNCKQLEKKLLLAESKSVSMLLENYKLKKKLNAILQAQNSWSAISPQFNEIENTSNIPHPESISQDLFKKNTMTLGDPGAPESEEVFNKIENLMAELTRMMDNLENANATNNFTGHFTNSTHLTNNNTYQLINSANNINFNSTTNILNSNNNSRVHARVNPNLQQTISMHHGPDISKSFSRVHQPRHNPNMHNYSEQNALTPQDKSDNQESKVNTQFSLFFQNENSHMNHSHS